MLLIGSIIFGFWGAACFLSAHLYGTGNCPDLGEAADRTIWGIIFSLVSYQML